MQGNIELCTANVLFLVCKTRIFIHTFHTNKNVISDFQLKSNIFEALQQCGPNIVFLKYISLGWYALLLLQTVTLVVVLTGLFLLSFWVLCHIIPMLMVQCNSSRVMKLVFFCCCITVLMSCGSGLVSEVTGPAGIAAPFCSLLAFPDGVAQSCCFLILGPQQNGYQSDKLQRKPYSQE